MTNRDNEEATWEAGARAESSGSEGREGERERCDGRGRRRGRKERVLHTRISEELSEDIRRLAEDLRVPTSNLVRNVLEEVFSVVESVSGNVGDLFEDLFEEAEGARQRVQRQMEQREERHKRRSDHQREWLRRRRERHRRRHGSAASDANVEEELRRDEASERAATGGTSSGDGASTAKAPRVPKEFPDVLGWQPLVLNRAQACADCGVHLQKGERAFLGVKTAGISELALCAECVRN